MKNATCNTGSAPPTAAGGGSQAEPTLTRGSLTADRRRSWGTFFRPLAVAIASRANVFSVPGGPGGASSPDNVAGAFGAALPGRLVALQGRARGLDQRLARERLARTAVAPFP